MKTPMSDLEKLQVLKSLPPVDLKNAGELEARIKLYFDYCCEKELKPSVASLCVSLGHPRQSLWACQQRDNRCGELIRSAKQELAALLEQWQLDGDINPTTAIWLQKNHFGYNETIEIQGTENRPDADSIARRFTVSKNDADERLENQINHSLGINDKGNSKKP